MKKYDCYIASGFFNENELRDLEDIKRVCNKINIKYFSPKDEIICSPDADNESRKKIFKGNLRAIKKSNFVIANTRDKDMGTLFECGYAFSLKKPIIYYCEGLEGNFNLMLSCSGVCVASNIEELENHLSNIMKDINYYKVYNGTIE